MIMIMLIIIIINGNKVLINFATQNLFCIITMIIKYKYNININIGINNIIL